VIFVRRSILTGQERVRDLPVTLPQLHAWEARGDLIQDAMPHLSPDDREWLINGTTPAEREAYLGVEEEPA
jgi:hypothetical protein